MARQKAARSLLIGTWRSDKVRTIKQWDYPKWLAVAKRRGFESIFGKLVMRCTASKHYVTHEGKTRARPYRILRSREGPTFPQIVVVYGTGTDESARHIFFDAPDAFYVQALRLAVRKAAVGQGPVRVASSLGIQPKC
jgi:hypothetical protein